ncbi:class F sortase [Prescottella agglutinans]|uniref:class F sortase n=1 Tax=Prescottella agglutinans TaxID=1644129 RepID=UPI003D97D08A
MGRHSRERRSGSGLLVVVLLVLLAVGGGLIYTAIGTAGKPLTAPVPETPFDVGAVPETGAQWAPPPADLGPRTLAIPDLGVRAEVVSTGVGARGSMVLPPPAEVSHLDNGVQYGAPAGTNLIAGHVDDGDRTRGAMWALHRIKPGTPIYVTDDTGRMWTYRAASLKLYDKVALPVEFFSDTGAPRLVLVTCGGETIPDPYLPSGFTYKDNVVVTADPI